MEVGERNRWIRETGIKEMVNTQAWIIIFVRIIRRHFREKVKSGSYSSDPEVVKLVFS